LFLVCRLYKKQLEKAEKSFCIKMKFSKSAILPSSIKWASDPVIFAVVLRYAPGPGYFYGNKRVLDKPIAYEIVEDFLSESNIASLREWVFTERRFATAVDAAARGVESIGEDEPKNAEGGCDEMTFSAGPQSETCKFSGRADIGLHFIKTGGHRGMKETPEKLISSILSFINYYPDKINDPEIKKLFEDEEYLVRNKLKSRKSINFFREKWEIFATMAGAQKSHEKKAISSSARRK
jgi:hypothetical protein